MLTFLYHSLFTIRACCPVCPFQHNTLLLFIGFHVSFVFHIGADIISQLLDFAAFIDVPFFTVPVIPFPAVIGISDRMSELVIHPAGVACISPIIRTFRGSGHTHIAILKQSQRKICTIFTVLRGAICFSTAHTSLCYRYIAISACSSVFVPLRAHQITASEDPVHLCRVSVRPECKHITQCQISFTLRRIQPLPFSFVQCDK